MKFLIVTAIREFEKEIKQILKKSKVQTFSYQHVTGHKNLSNESIEGNWFAGDFHEFESVMFYVMTDAAYIGEVLAQISAFNEGQKTASKIHVAVMNIEQTN